MIHTENQNVKNALFSARFGLEKESLRVYEDATFAKSDPPCADNEHIVRDFAQNQTEINTPVADSPKQALDTLYTLEKEIQNDLAARTPQEYLWPFSNPPVIRDENDIPIAVFEGKQKAKTEYRKYLSDKYGRYKMTFSGIHINFSFGEDLLQADFPLSGFNNFQEYKNHLYLHLASAASRYGWILTALLAASPILDSSYAEKGCSGTSLFLGLSSIRSSELGYWNFFTPIFDYSSLDQYVKSIQNYIDQGLICQASELYYPIRLKPVGENRLENFKDGISHIELRMADLNPLSSAGLDERDLQFVHLFLIWLASLKEEEMSPARQVYAAANFKNAAHYDLKTVRILDEKGKNVSMIQEAKNILEKMMEFYKDQPEEVEAILAYEWWKLEQGPARASWKLKELLQDGYLEKGMELARYRQYIALQPPSTPENTGQIKKNNPLGEGIKQVLPEA